MTPKEARETLARLALADDENTRAEIDKPEWLHATVEECLVVLAAEHDPAVRLHYERIMGRVRWWAFA